MYRLTENPDFITRIEDGASIPAEPANTDYQAYLAWVALGNVPTPFTPPLEELLADVDAMRDAKVGAGLFFAGNLFDSDDRSRGNLAAVVAAIGAGIPLPEGFTWRSADNVDVPMTAANAVAFGATMIGYVDACYNNAWALKDALRATKDPAAVDIQAGWPA